MKEIEEQIEEKSAKLAAYQAEEMIEESIKSYMAKIESSNQGMTDWEDGLVRDAGYSRNGNSIKRSAAVGATVWNVKYKTQRVHAYEDFKTAAPVIAFSADSLNGLGSAQILTAIQESQRQLEAWGKKIFGEQKAYKSGGGKEKAENDANKAKYEALEKRGYENLNALEQDEYSRLAGVLFSSEGGEFNAHTGKAAEFKNPPDPSKSRR